MVFGLTTVFITYALVRLHEHYEKNNSHLPHDKAVKKTAREGELEIVPENLLLDKSALSGLI